MVKHTKRPRDPMERAFEIGEESTAKPAEDVDALVSAFWEETGVIAPMVEIRPPLTDKWGEDERWRLWREWIEKRKKGGKKGGPARAAALSPERRREIAKKAAKARWATRRD